MAEKIGLDSDKLSQSLNGKRKLDTEEFSRIISVLNVSADTFIKLDVRDG